MLTAGPLEDADDISGLSLYLDTIKEKPRKPPRIFW